MKKIILSLAVSFDGYIEGPNGELDWLTFSEETGKVLNAFLSEIDTVLYGRVSYEKWGNYNPPATSTEFEKSFYSKLNQMTKYVFTSSKKSYGENVLVINSEIEKVIKDLKQQQGKNIWLYGGAGLITTFINLNLVDEFRIAVFPIILGAGKPLFKDINHRVKLKLLDINASNSGAVQFKYASAVTE